MIWIGVLIVLLTFAAIVKRYETRLVLFAAGLAMAAAAGKPLAAFDAFAKAMVNEGLVTTICTVMGFSYVMKLTGCDSHLVQCLTGALTRVKFLLIPGAVVLTWLLNIALPSTAGEPERHSTRPRASARSIIAAACASDIASGFSHSTWQPASSAASVCAACCSLVELM